MNTSTNAAVLAPIFVGSLCFQTDADIVLTVSAAALGLTADDTFGAGLDARDAMVSAGQDWHVDGTIGVRFVFTACEASVTGTFDHVAEDLLAAGMAAIAAFIVARDAENAEDAAA